jgi:hypothetical protein
LAPGSHGDLTGALGGGDYTFIDRSQPAAGDLDDAIAEKQYWIWLLGALLALLALETYLARRFGHWT